MKKGPSLDYNLFGGDSAIWGEGKKTLSGGLNKHRGTFAVGGATFWDPIKRGVFGEFMGGRTSGVAHKKKSWGM